VTGETPEGWDQIDPEMIESAKALREVFVSLLAAGFPASEAAMVIGAIIAQGGKA
jgi:hypothetical protein